MRKIKTEKRLTLCKETLQNLDNDMLRKAPGQGSQVVCTNATVACTLCHTC
jgi:hypothetical protein